MLIGRGAATTPQDGKETTPRWALRYTVKKSLSNFPCPAGVSLMMIKLSLGGNNLIIPVQGEFGQ
jgi:hypothetical protein